MNNKTIRIQELTKMFIGIEIPDDVREQIRIQLEGYTKYTKKLVEEENWHVKMLSIGEIEGHDQFIESLSAEMPQSFLSTLSLTHIGKGPQRQQLWAFVNPTPLLDTLQKQLIGRLDSLNIKPTQDTNFIPHIKLADLRVGSSNNLLADIPMPAIWPIKKLSIYRSDLSHRQESYTVMGHINLSA